MGRTVNLYEQIEEMFDAGQLDTTYPPSVYEAYLKAQGAGIVLLQTFPTQTADLIASHYIGYFSNRREFIDCYIIDVLRAQIPSTLSIDYNTTWEADLRHQFDYVPGDDEANGGGWYFHKR